jgi:RNA polymerase sigma factor (sigma-70 family)
LHLYRELPHFVTLFFYFFQKKFFTAHFYSQHKVALNAAAWQLPVFQSKQSNQSSKIESFDYTFALSHSAFCNQAMHPDTRYIQALLHNDNQVIGEIYARFSARIARFVQGNNGSTDDARDLFQEALIAVARQAQRPGFVLTCPFEAYLYCVCRGKWLNELKRRQRETVTISEASGYEDIEQADALADATLREDDRDRLFRRFFEKLSANCRQLLQLAWSGISMEKVSQELGMSYNYARKKKHECVSRMMAQMQASPEFALIKNR